MARILAADKIDPEGIAILQRAGHEVVVRTGLDEGALCAAVVDCEGLIVRSSTTATARVIEAGTALRAIARAGIGVDTIDVDAATRRGILVINSAQGNVVSAAEHAVALLCAVSRNVARADRMLRGKVWNRKALQGVELRGHTLGLVGLGHVGGEVARIARGFGMKVIADDPYCPPERAEELGVRLTDMDTVLSESDFLSLHVPLTDGTRNLIDGERLTRMKSTAFLINCARGGVVDETALTEALREGTIAGAGLDVFESEPLGDSPLLDLDNVVLTPHLGGSTGEAHRKVAVDIAEQLARFFRDGSLPRAVNAVSVRDPQLAPFADLAETLGSFAAQLAGGRILGIRVNLRGELAEGPPEPLTVAALAGGLGPTSDRANRINARWLADDRGIEVSESRTPGTTDFHNRLVVSVRSDRGAHAVSGTVVDGTELRILQVDDYDLNLVPAEHMLVMAYPDRPGMVGKFGTILGDRGINIARMEVGRQSRGEQAMVVLSLDEPLPKEALADLEKALRPEILRRIRLAGPAMSAGPAPSPQSAKAGG